jgi:flagella basal body P-ring formation protein FlgA
METIEVLHLGVASLPSCAETGRFLVESASMERFLGAAEVRVQVHGAEGPCTSLTLRPRLRVWVETPVAAAVAKPGDTVAWRIDRWPLDQMEGTPLTTAVLEARPWLARTTLRAGEPLTDTHLRPKPDAMGGDEVWLLAGSSNLVVKATGRLVADASVGAAASVANLSTRTVVSGTLIAPGCVAIGGITPRIQEACTDARKP